VGAGYFETVGIPLLVGRVFRPEDNPPSSPPVPIRNNDPLGPPAPVAIVNETFARHYFPNQNPIGKHISQGEAYNPARSSEIVGVVKDAKYFGVREAIERMVYLPIWRLGAGGRVLCIRSTGRPELIGAIRREVACIDPGVPVLQALTVEEQFNNLISAGNHWLVRCNGPRSDATLQ
jgi:putative ABC transport system permease protein